jgi:hypothetical protein
VRVDGSNPFARSIRYKNAYNDQLVGPWLAGFIVWSTALALIVGIRGVFGGVFRCGHWYQEIAFPVGRDERKFLPRFPSLGFVPMLWDFNFELVRKYRDVVGLSVDPLSELNPL